MAHVMWAVCVRVEPVVVAVVHDVAITNQTHLLQYFVQRYSDCLRVCVCVCVPVSLSVCVCLFVYVCLCLCLSDR